MSNPAMTLYWHLHKLARLNQDAQSWPDGWKQVLGGVDWADAVGPLLGLLERTERIVESQPDLAPGAAMYHKSEWQRAILLHRVNLDVTMNQSGFGLTEPSNYALYTLAMLIKNLPEVAADAGKERLDHLAAAVTDLREDIVNSEELEADLRTFLLDQVNKMQSRIDLVRVTGSGPVEDLVAETIGSGAVDASKWKRAMDSAVRDKIVALFIAFQAIVGMLDTTAAAIESTGDHIKGAAAVIEYIFGDPPKQIDAPRGPKALPPGSDTASVDSPT